MTNYPNYTNILKIDSDGNILCDALSFSNTGKVPRDGFIQRIVDTRTFSVGQQTALRGRIILAAAERKPNVHISKEQSVTLDTVRLWRKRWLDLQPISLDDLTVEERLQDLPRPGAPARFSADQVSQIVTRGVTALACEKPEDSGRPITQWSSREIADEIIQRGIVG